MHLLIVDDHRLFVGALTGYIGSRSEMLSDTPLKFTAAFTLDHAIECIRDDHAPDLVFLDLNLDRNDRGTATFEKLQSHNRSRIPVVILSGMDLYEPKNIGILRECLFPDKESFLFDFAALGFIPKGSSVEDAFVGLGRLLSKEPWIPQHLMREIVAHRQSEENTYPLSSRQRQVAECLTRGLQNREIARELKLSPLWVTQITAQIYKKLRVSNRTKAAGVLLNAGYGVTRQ